MGSFFLLEATLKLDLLLLLASTSNDQFNIQKEKAKEIVKSFSIGLDETKVGLMIYGKNTRRRIFVFNRFKNLDELTEGINGVKNLPSWQSLPESGIKSYLTKGVEIASNFLQDKTAGARSNVPKSLVIFTPEEISVTDEMEEFLQNVEYSFVHQKKTGDIITDIVPGVYSYCTLIAVSVDLVYHLWKQQLFSNFLKIECLVTCTYDL